MEHGATGDLQAKPAEVKKPETNEAKAGEAQLRMTIHITRKATGKTETYELIGKPEKED